MDATCWKPRLEGTALIDHRFDRQLAMMTQQDMLDDRQLRPGALGFPKAVLVDAIRRRLASS